MAIKTWILDGKTHYEIDLNVRSKINKSIRIQKRKSGILNEVNSEITIPQIERIQTQLRDEVIREIKNRECKGILWKDLVEKWFAHLHTQQKSSLIGNQKTSLAKLSSSTIRHYVQSISDFTDAWMNRPAEDILPADVEILFESMTKAGYSNCSQYNVKVAISRCFLFGIKRRLIPRVTVSPTIGFGISRKESKRPEVLTVSQLHHLLDTAKAEKHDWYSVWKGAYHTGGRSGELYELRAKDLDLVSRRGTFERKFNFLTKEIEHFLKDSEWRQFPINNDLMDLLIELGVEKMKPDDYVFPRISAWRNGAAAIVLREYCTSLGLPSICFHTIRACWATHLLSNGVSPTKVLTMGGWADLKTMQRYVRLAGIEVDGATDCLSVRGKERPARVLKLISSL